MLLNDMEKKRVEGKKAESKGYSRCAVRKVGEEARKSRGSQERGNQKCQRP